MLLELPRWKIISIKERENKVHIKDYLFNKERVYMIPNLSSAKLDGDDLVAHTHKGKIMRIRLPSGSRRFVAE